MSRASLDQLTRIAREHVTAEAAGDFDGVMRTLEAEPVMSLYPCSLKLRGRERIERFYKQFFIHFQPRTVDYELLSECVGTVGVVQEYDIKVQTTGDQAQTFRVMAILTFGRTALSGERLYASDAFLKAMLGASWDELEPI